MTGLDFYTNVWAPAEGAISDIERNGICLDERVCKEAEAQCLEKLAEYEEELNEWAGQELNWRSPKQISEYLYENRGFKLPPVKGTLRAIQGADDEERPTSEVSLLWLSNQVGEGDAAKLRLLARHKKLAREASFHALLPTHVSSDGRIHCQLSPSTETGRLSCKNPNLQQIPPAAREGFVAAPGHALVVLDYPGLEWRILAHAVASRYGDYSLVEDVQAGVDPHNATAKRTFGLGTDVSLIKERHPKERAAAKIINYSIPYGKTPFGMSLQLSFELDEQVTTRDAQKFLDDFMEGSPGVARFIGDMPRYAELRGYVRTLLGRYRYLKECHPTNPSWLRRKGARLAVNSPIQGSAADIVTMAMLRCAEIEGARTVLQVHDELVLEVPEDRAETVSKEAAWHMEHCLEGVKEFLCPLGPVKPGIGNNWREAGDK